MYNVVFEYLPVSGGFAGCRTWTSYKNRRQFLRSFQAISNQRVLKEDVSDEEAIELTSQTPEVSRIKAAIEESYLQGVLDPNLLTQAHLPKALFAVQFDRQQTGREPYFVERLPQINSSLTGKESLFAAVDACASPDRRVDLSMISRAIKIPLLVIILDQCNLLGPEKPSMDWLD